MLRLTATWVLSCVLLGCGARSPLQSGSGADSSPGQGGESAARTKPATGCDDPEPILQTGTTIESGFVRCADGFVHRTHAVTCVAPTPPSNEAGCESPNNPNVCTSAWCTLGAYGACVNVPPFGDCDCIYGCATDADCRAGEICACAGVMGGVRCIPAACAASSECGKGLCGLAIDVDSCGERDGQLACHDDSGACRVDTDCSFEEAAWCAYAPPKAERQCRPFEGVWSCADPFCGPCG